MAFLRKLRDDGELFPGFVDLTEIGVGTIATVYSAREVATGRRVALKLLNVRDASPRAIESFERESRALGAVSAHPNIVTLYGTIKTPDGRPVLILELCQGSVADPLREGERLRVRDAVSIGIKISGALETAHRAGILHRDVKPQNILLTGFGEPALSDFGVAMLQSATQTTAGLFDFTTLHAAPELLEGGAVSAATDVYELASTLYQLIAGESAFRAFEGESPASVILRILRDPVRPVIAEGVPIALSDLLIRGMSKEKEDRPQSAAEFARELAYIERERGWPATHIIVPDTETVQAVLDDEPAGHVPAVPVEGGAPALRWELPAGRPVRQEPPPPPEPSWTERADWWTPAAAAESSSYPVAPSGAAEPPARSDVPVFADRRRNNAPFGVPFVGDLAIDPASLRPKLTVRSGLSSVLVSDEGLQVRSTVRRTHLTWGEVWGFEQRIETGGSTGILVAITAVGPVPLGGTSRPVADLAHLHALFEAYRQRGRG